MKSMIDWNEIVPRLSKAKREELYLEAVMILAQGDKPVTKPHTNGTDRTWGVGHGNLTGPGVKYSINKTAKTKFRTGAKIAKLWDLLVESKKDVITFEGLSSLAAGQKLTGVSATNYLWSKRLLERHDVIEGVK